MPRSFSSLRPLRIVLWLLPLVFAVLLIVGKLYVDAAAGLAEAEEMLLIGQAHAAADAVEPFVWLPGLRAQTATLALIVGALEEATSRTPGRAQITGQASRRPGQGPVSGELAIDAFDISLMARAAFARGEFTAVLRLAEVADVLSRPVLPVLRLAAQIEAGIVARQEPGDERGSTQTDRVLAARVAAHLASAPGGVTLRSRAGRDIASLTDEGLVLDASVSPRWLPSALEAAAHRVAATGSLNTSVDIELSRLAAEALGDRRGSIVLVEPQSGEILAAVSDRRTVRLEGGTPALEQMREPASISKLITTAAYERAGGDADARLRPVACCGHASYDGQRLYCASIAGPLRGLDRAMAVSCNVAFAELARDIGRAPLLAELHRFGFGRPLGAFDGGRVVEALGDARQLADLAIGLDATEVTPLHAAMLAAVVANGGWMPEPTLVRSRDGWLGLHPRSLEKTPARRVLGAHTVSVLRRAMIAVAERGSGARMRTRGFPVAMKTGTASHPMHGFHVNYIGFGPLPEARVAFCVRITHEATSRRVRQSGAEVTARLLRKLRTVSRQREWRQPVVAEAPAQSAANRLASASRGHRQRLGAGP